MENYTESEINHILELYKKSRERNKLYYDKIKDTDEFKKKNRERAKKHYQENKTYKQQKKQDYNNNKEFLLARSSYYYYNKKNKLDVMKEKYPDKYELMTNYLNSQKPPSVLTGTTSSSSPDE